MQNKSVRRVSLGELIEITDSRNSDCMYDGSYVKGMTITKEIIDTKANVSGADLSKYYIVQPNEFVYNPRTHGKRIGLGFNQTARPFLISWNNVSFKIKNTSRLLPIYLYLYISRLEWDREACYQSWGSSTEVFSWNSFCSMKIPLPSITTQQELVDTWKGLRNMKEENEAIASPLFSLCQSYIQELKHKYVHKEIGSYIKTVDETNKENRDLEILGININKEFMPTIANTSTIDIKKYKVLTKGRFVFSGMQTGRDECIRIGLYNEDVDAIISPAYTTFEIEKTSDLLPEFLFLCFKRHEMDRYGWFISDSSVRANLDWNRFVSISIPIPPIDIQQAVVDMYNCANDAKKIAEEADILSKNICPALIQHVIHNN